MGENSAWWYALVSASPNPEAGEAINVGLLFGNGRPAFLEFDENLSRLKCLADRFERKMYSDILNDIRSNIRHTTSVSELNQIYGPQLKVSDPRPLYQQPNKTTINRLRRHYLGAVRSRRTHSEERKAVTLVDETISRVAWRYAEPLTQKKRALPEDLYPRDAKKIFETPVPAIDRVLRTRDKDLLIGAARIGSRKPESAIQGKGTKLGRAFWQYREARPRIEDLTGCRVRMVGLIYNGDGNDQEPEVRDAIEYLSHLWS